MTRWQLSDSEQCAVLGAMPNIGFIRGWHRNDPGSLPRMADGLATSIRTVQEKEALLQSVIDAVPDGIRVIGEDYKILLANQTYCQQLGYSSAEVIHVACHRSSHNREHPCPPTLITCPLVEIGKTGRP